MRNLTYVDIAHFYDNFYDSLNLDKFQFHQVILNDHNEHDFFDNLLIIYSLCSLSTSLVISQNLSFFLASHTLHQHVTHFLILSMSICN
jgi:hypothetical protein